MTKKEAIYKKYRDVEQKGKDAFNFGSLITMGLILISMFFPTGIVRWIFFACEMIVLAVSVSIVAKCNGEQSVYEKLFCEEYEKEMRDIKS